MRRFKGITILGRNRSGIKGTEILSPIHGLLLKPLLLISVYSLRPRALPPILWPTAMEGSGCGIVHYTLISSRGFNIYIVFWRQKLRPEGCGTHAWSEYSVRRS